MCPASTRSNAPGGRRSSTYGKWHSRMRRSACSSTSSQGLDVPRRYARGSTPTICTRLPRTSTVALSSTRRCAGVRSVRPAVRENGSLLCSTSWFPRTTYGLSSSASSVRSIRSPRGRETRSPVTQTSSGRRSRTHSTARSTAREPREGSPRWKSDRWATRTPSSSGGSRGSTASSGRSRTQPASNQPQPTPAPTTPPKRAPARDLAIIAPETAPPIVRRCRSARSLASDFQLFEHRSDRHDVPLELQLRVRKPGGDADELRQVEDRHLEVLAGRGLQLRLPRVEREVAERARRDDRVRAGLLGLLDRLDQLAEGRLLARLDDREPTALDLRGVVDRLAPAGLDDPLQRPGPVRILEAEDLRRPQDLAAVERRDLQALEALVRRLLQQLVALALRDLPEQVAHLDVAAVGRDPDALQVVAHALTQSVVVLQLPVGLSEIERADVAHRQQRVAACRLRVRKDPRVEVQVVVGLRLVDVAGAAARHGLQLDELQADLRRERLRRRIELLGGEGGEAALAVGDASHPSAGGGSTPGWSSGPFSRAPASSLHSVRPSACSPCTMPSAPSRPCSFTRL